MPHETDMIRTLHPSLGVIATSSRSLSSSDLTSNHAIMNDTIRTSNLTSKSAFPPFHIHGWQQILLHRDPFTQGRLQSNNSGSPTSYNRKSFPRTIEYHASDTHVDGTIHENGDAARHTSISNRNIQVLRAINDVQLSQIDSLAHELEEASASLHERQLDLSYIAETELLAKDEIFELRQQLREKEEALREKDAIIQRSEELLRRKDELLREKDELMKQKDAGIWEQTHQMTEKNREILQAKTDIEESNRILDETNRILDEIETDRKVFHDHESGPSSELDLSTDKHSLTQQSNLTKRKSAFKEMLHAVKANTHARKSEDREAESRRVSETSRHPGTKLNDDNGKAGKGGRTKSFTLRSLVGRRSRAAVPS